MPKREPRAKKTEEVKEPASQKDAEDIRDIVDRICDRIDSMCCKMNDAILDAYGISSPPRRKWWNLF